MNVVRHDDNREAGNHLVETCQIPGASQLFVVVLPGGTLSPFRKHSKFVQRLVFLKHACLPLVCSIFQIFVSTASSL